MTRYLAVFTLVFFCLLILNACGGSDGPPVLDSITISPAALNVALGETQQFSATGTYSDHHTADLAGTVEWSTGSPTIATISLSGSATGLAQGTTVVTATSGAVSATTILTVTPATVTSIAVTPSPALAGVGIPTRLVATGTFTDGTTSDLGSKATWMSNAPSVATVDSGTGVAVGVSLGSATITATVGSVTGTVQLTVANNAWITTGSLTTPRMNYTASLLTNGKVLVVGGTASNAELASAEIYDPAAGTWSATGTMTTARHSHTATRLADGKVLIAGGYSGGNALASAELYDPALGVWSVSGNLTEPRGDHTATLLANGSVLAAGGREGGITLKSAEVYNPATAVWTVTGSMAKARGEHTATVLEDGNVLVGGGVDYQSVSSTPSAEIYDTSAGTWAITGSLLSSRFAATATLLPGGAVLLAGGSFLQGTGETPVTTVETYDSTTGMWSATESLLMGALAATTTLLTNGNVLATALSSDQMSNVAQIYDPQAGSWMATASPLSFVTSATLLLNGTVLGIANDGTASVFDIATGN